MAVADADKYHTIAVTVCCACAMSMLILKRSWCVVLLVSDVAALMIWEKGANRSCVANGVGHVLLLVV